MRDPRISEVGEGLRSTNISLDEDLAGHANVGQLLAQAGLELWQAPEGFWAVRLKQAAQAAPVVRLRRRSLRRTK